MSDLGYGSIYAHTHWGAGDAFTNQIGWGAAYFYIYAAAAFNDRVQADGGIFEDENFRCVNKAIRRLPQADLGRTYYEAYETRVTTDSGTVEARDCVITEINNLL